MGARSPALPLSYLLVFMYSPEHPSEFDYNCTIDAVIPEKEKAVIPCVTAKVSLGLMHLEIISKSLLGSRDGQHQQLPNPHFA